MSYRVIIIGSKGPELLGTFEDKGQCRRAWATAKKGAAITTEDGRVLEHKSGTPRGVEAALAREALRLARGAAPAPAPVAPPVIAETPKPRPAKRDKTRCESCDEPLPGHLTTCPRVPSTLHVSIEKATVTVEEIDEIEAPPSCAAKGCEDPRAGVRVDTKPVFAPFCVAHRKLMKDRVRDRKLAPELLADALREGRDLDELGARPVTPRTSPSAAIVVERAPVVDQEFEVNEPVGPDSFGGTDFPELPPSEPVEVIATRRDAPVYVGDRCACGVEVPFPADQCAACVARGLSADVAPVEPPPAAPSEPVTIDEVLSAAKTVFCAYGDWGLTITADVARITFCGSERVSVRRAEGVDPLRQLAASLATQADELVTVRERIIDETERELAAARMRLVEATLLAGRLRSVGA